MKGGYFLFSWKYADVFLRSTINVKALVIDRLGTPGLRQPPEDSITTYLYGLSLRKEACGKQFEI